MLVSAGASILATLAGSATFAQSIDVPVSPSATPNATQTSDMLRIGGDTASAWNQGSTRVLFIENNVTIKTDDTTLSADRAVIWLDSRANDAGGTYTVQVALLGSAKVVRNDITREGGELFVTLHTRPDVKLEAGSLDAVDRGTDVHYLAGAQLRRQAERGEIATNPPTRAPVLPTTGPTSRPAREAVRSTVYFRSDRAPTAITPESKLAFVMSGRVVIIQHRTNGDIVELQADSAVLFTQKTDMKQLMESNQLKSLDPDADLDAVYLEGDVRMELTPADEPGKKPRPRQSLRASRIVYEFATDRAILTDALLHSVDPRAEAPIVVRAQAMKKLGTDSYQADKASISTSSMATPSISLSASKVTVRQEQTGDKQQNTRTVFRADNVTPRIYGTPVFWFPRLWGSETEGSGLPLRNITLSHSNGFGYGIASQWGLYETIGEKPPENVDASYRVDYYSERGPAFGLDANYAGGFVGETNLQPWNFNGGFTGYIVQDDGIDRLSKRRLRISHDEEVRGRFKWDHQHFLTDGWQLQARLGYVSDATFLEEWFRNEFRNGLPQETALYLKRSQNTEVMTALFNYDLNGFATVADQLQEVRGDASGYYPVTVERLPEVSYHRLGDSLWDDQLTFVSNNTLSGLRFSDSRYNLREFGFRNPSGGVDEGFAGLPSYGYTGFSDDYVGRGDFRQEIAQPMGDDRVRVTPYAVVRLTGYTDSPDGDAQTRVLGGVGVRSSTQFYKVYDDVDSKLFDIHRVRHIVEPQINLFASAQSIDRDELYIYDEGIDGISDAAAAQFVVKQRFQTKRGGEGRWRNVDFLTLNTGVTMFANEPEEPTSVRGNDFGTAGSFRGTYFNSLPEASTARSTAFADATWRISDTTALLADTAWNVEENNLATTGVGFAVQRDPRVRYFAGVRYIGEVNSTIGTISIDYKLTDRYLVSVNQSFDLSNGESQSTSLQLVRYFEQYIFTLDVYFDRLEDQGGIGFSVSPRGLPFGMSVSDGGARR